MADSRIAVDKTPQDRPFSLRRQLLLWLLLPQLLLWTVGGALAYRMALSYAEKGIDQSLLQSVRSLARQVKPVGSGLLIDFPKAAQAIIEEDPSDKVSYMVSNPPGLFVLGNATLPEPPLEVRRVLASLTSTATGTPEKSAEALLYAALADGREAQPQRALRVAVMELSFGDDDPPQRLRVQVAKSQAVQERIARELIYDMIVPLLLIGALLSVFVYFGITRGLQPLAKLQDRLQAKSDRREQGAPIAPFTPIRLDQAPQEVHSLAVALNQLLAVVERSVGQEKRFLNDAAHQLRTPLAGLKAQLDLALNEASDPMLRERLLKVNAGVERSSHLVHQLLQLARSEAAIEMQTIDALALIRSIAQDAAPAALAAGVDFGFEAPDAVEPIMIEAHPLFLREAIENLIDNAVRYAGAGAVVTLRVRRENQLEYPVIIELEDNGPGLNEAQRSQMFERFWRGSELPGGAGLGLSIVQEIVLRHRGRVLSMDAPERGLMMQILLNSAPN